MKYLGADCCASVAIVMEYISGGCIESLLKNFGPFPDMLLRAYTAQVYRHAHFFRCLGRSWRVLGAATANQTDKKPYSTLFGTP